MYGADPSAASTLRVLMEDQARSLDELLADLAVAVGNGLHLVPPQQWTGPARDAHDRLVRRMTTQLDAARSCLERARAESRHAAETLGGRD